MTKWALLRALASHQVDTTNILIPQLVLDWLAGGENSNSVIVRKLFLYDNNYPSISNESLTHPPSVFDSYLKIIIK